MKYIPLFFIAVAGFLGLFLLSCKKKKTQQRDFYRAQQRDGDVTGLYRLQDTEDSATVILWHFRDSGEIERYIVREGKEYKAPGYYWYTKAGKLHKLFYPGSWDKGTYEETAAYWLSAAKDTLYIREDYSHLINTLVRQ